MLNLKKALSSAFFVAWFFSAGAVKASCVPDVEVQPVSVTKVVDGDTVKLSNGRSVRLLGINTPELNWRSGDPEPYASEAKKLLSDLVQGAQAGLILGAEPEDRYKRLLGHLFVNGHNAAEQLLEKGLGWATVIEPNTDQADCLFAAEERARAERLGVWSEALRSAGEIQRGGYALVRGRVTRIDATPKYIYLEVDDHLALRLTRRNFLPDQVVKIGQSFGQLVEARGWVIDRRAKLGANSAFKGFLLPLGSRWHLRFVAP